MAAPGDAVDVQDAGQGVMISNLLIVTDENTGISDESLAALGAAVDDIDGGDQGGTISHCLIVPPEDVENTGVSDESCGCAGCCC